MSYTRCMLDKQGYMHAHTHKYVIPLFHGDSNSRTRLNVTYTVCLSVCLLYSIGPAHRKENEKTGHETTGISFQSTRTLREPHPSDSSDRYKIAYTTLFRVRWHAQGVDSGSNATPRTGRHTNHRRPRMLRANADHTQARLLSPTTSASHKISQWATSCRGTYTGSRSGSRETDRAMRVQR
jgi:hypothetical protein